jgi:hypothetical protein
MEPITYQRITEASNTQNKKFIDLLLILENQTPNITLTPLAFKEFLENATGLTASSYMNNSTKYSTRFSSPSKKM